MHHQSTTFPQHAESTSEPPTEDAAPVVLIPLRGKHGEGRAAVLDADDHARLCAASAGPLSVLSDGKGNTYVVSPRGIGRPHRNELVARWIVGARRGEVVTYHDGNSLNLRRRNLLVLRGEALARWRRRTGIPTPAVREADMTPTERLLRDADRLTMRVGTMGTPGGREADAKPH